MDMDDSAAVYKPMDDDGTHGGLIGADDYTAMSTEYSYGADAEKEGRRKKAIRWGVFVVIGIVVVVVVLATTLSGGGGGGGSDDDDDNSGGGSSGSGSFQRTFGPTPALSDSCNGLGVRLGAAFQDTSRNTLVNLPTYAKRMMDEDANPCQDFVQFACGNYIDDQAPVDGDTVSSNALFNDVGLNNRLIKQSLFDSHTKEAGLLGRFYESCMDLSKQRTDGISYLVDAIFPAYNEPFASGADFVKASTNSGFLGSILFDASVGLDEDVSDKTYLILDPDALVDDFNTWAGPLNETFHEENVAYVANILQTLGVQAGYAEAVIALERNISTLNSATGWEDTVYSRANLSALADWDWDIILARLSVPAHKDNFLVVASDGGGTFFSTATALFDELIAAGQGVVLNAWAKWHVYMSARSIMDSEIAAPDPPQPAIVGDGQLFKAQQRRLERSEAEYALLKELLDLAHKPVHEPPQSLMHRVLEALALDDLDLARVSPLKLLKHVRRYFEEEGRELDIGQQRYWDGTTNAPVCAQMSEMVFNDLVGKIYADLTWTDGTMEMLNDLVDRVISSLRKQMQDNAWLDAETKAKAIDKLNNIKKRIGYKPEQDRHGLIVSDSSFLANMWRVSEFNRNQAFKTLFEEVDRSAWDDPPYGSALLLNAYYRPDANNIALPAGLVQQKLFAPELPAAYRFGGYGAIVGHELSHGFDNNGRMYGPTGRFENWWSDASAAEFEQRAQCFVNSYDALMVPETTTGVNGTKTLGENLADNAGVAASYLAMKDYLKQHHEKRHDLTHYNDDQLFFIAYAQNWCAAINGPAVAAQQGPDHTDPHSPGFARILGVVTNSDTFASAFKCSAGSPMNPANKCVLW